MTDTQSGIKTDIDPNISFAHTSSGHPISDGATVTMAQLVHIEAISMRTVEGYGPGVAQRVRERLPGNRHS